MYKIYFNQVIRKSLIEFEYNLAFLDPILKFTSVGSGHAKIPRFVHGYYSGTQVLVLPEHLHFGLCLNLFKPI